MNIELWMIGWAAAAVLVAGIFLFLIDDLFIDAVSKINGLRPLPVSEEEVRLLSAQPEKLTAVLIANWKEHDVLEKMIAGNISRIFYRNYSFFLGVYPNDPETWAAARNLEQKFPNVFVVVNKLPGPTSKGQMLNEMVRQILASESITGLHHELFLLQDSEDIIHPLAFSLINQAADEFDFVQIPVFSLPTSRRQFVAGTYMDEFAESHTKDLLVRQHLGASVPSAGVGTAVNRRLMLALIEKQGEFLDPGSLTEDYQLGHQATRLGFRTSFHCRFLERDRDFVATREFFPDGIRQSIRQKTRWTIGIAYQGAECLGWKGSFAEKYFLWRDRRSIWNAYLLAGSFLLFFVFTGEFLISGFLPALAHEPWFALPCAVNLGLTCVRMGSRMACVSRVYGKAETFMVPLRWPVASVINTWTAMRARQIFHESKKRGEQPAWAKTEHKLPASFGADPVVQLSNRQPQPNPEPQEVRA